MKATEDQMIAEGAFRMKSVGLPQEVIDVFVNGTYVKVFDNVNGSLVTDDSDLDRWAFESVDNFNGGYPFAIIKEDISDFPSIEARVEYHILFVSEDPDNWERERKELSEMEPTLFHCIYDRDFYPHETDNKLVRRKIRLTENGTIVLA